MKLDSSALRAPGEGGLPAVPGHRPRELTLPETSKLFPKGIAAHLLPLSRDLDRARFVLCLGELIPSSKRKCFPEVPYQTGNARWSGEVGFMEFALQFQSHQALLMVIGIEPRFRGQGYGGRCLSYLEAVADLNELHSVSVREVVSERLAGMLSRRGYDVSYRDKRSFARIPTRSQRTSDLGFAPLAERLNILPG